VFEDISDINTFQLDNIDSSISIGSGFTIKEAFGLITIVLSKNADQHIRSYTKFQSLVANIGGIINFIYMISKFIVNYLTSKLLLLDYLNNRVTDCKREEDNRQDSPSITNIKLANVNNTLLQPNRYIIIYFKLSLVESPNKPGTVIKYTKAINTAYNFKLHKRHQLSIRDIIIPLLCLNSKDDIYRKIDNYVRNKLSLENIIKGFDQFERVKKYVFSKDELYVLSNIDNVNCKLSNEELNERFDIYKFKHSYLKVQVNHRFMSVIE
jgi:hypothetical protein